MRRFMRFYQLLILTAAFLGGCCTRPAIDIADYAHLREDPEECVRYFQLAVELGMWEAAADCLVSATENVGPWELWFISDRPDRMLGGLSLNEIIIGAYYIRLADDIPSRSRRAVVAILSHAKPDIDQRYDLVLVKQENRWFIDLDKTFDLNAVSR